MVTRTKVREHILTILYGYDIGNHITKEEFEQTLIDKHIVHKKAIFAQELYAVITYLQAIDDIVKPYLRGWQLERMGYMERSILRLASFELLYVKTPIKVAINEALELAKRYCAPNSHQYINGILHHICQDNLQHSNNDEKVMVVK